VTLRRRALLAGASLLVPAFAAGRRAAAGQLADEPVTAYIPFRNAPFPYDGFDPQTGELFLDVDQNGRKGHSSPRGGIYWQDTTYSDDRVLAAFSRNFRADRPGLIVLYYHGNSATLEDDILGRQQVVQQFRASGINGVLLAPQFAVDALDSSAGKFWQPGAVGRFLSEAAYRLAAFFDETARSVFAQMPVLLIAYSGGYEPAAYSLRDRGVLSRLIGVALLDAVFGEEASFVDFLLHRRSAFFLSAYTASAEPGNQAIEEQLERHGVPFTTAPPQRLRPSLISFIDSPGDHADFVTEAWVPNPITWILGAIGGLVQ
jgi:hypothetical protein